MYFPAHKIAVECDEMHHLCPKNKEADEKRQKEIVDILGCTFVRFDPFDKDFDIFVIVNRIMSLMLRN